jgi:hypothetical protein
MELPAQENQFSFAVHSIFVLALSDIQLIYSPIACCAGRDYKPSAETKDTLLGNIHSI